MGGRNDYVEYRHNPKPLQDFSSERSANDLLTERRFTNRIRRSHSQAGSWPGNSGHSPGGELLLLRILNAASMT
jgi:hypothetical protein